MVPKLAHKGLYFIAEIGVNYYDIAVKLGISPIEAAKLMIDEAAHVGVSAVKFQSYKAETLAAKFSPSYWNTTEESTQSQFELFKKYDSFDVAEYEELSGYANELGIDFLSTPFDFRSADYLFDLMPYYKISSSDITNLPFIEYISKKGKPVIISTGASNAEEIKKAYRAIREFNNHVPALLHCILEYPTPYEHANLLRIQSLCELFPDSVIGYSDHTKPDTDMHILLIAYLLGAQIIEKHFTLDKSLKGNDHYHAMDTEDVQRFIAILNRTDVALGMSSLDYLPFESSARINARRSLVAVRKICKGEVLASDMLTFKRPGTGVSPANLMDIIGKVAAADIDADTPITFADIDRRDVSA